MKLLSHALLLCLSLNLVSTYSFATEVASSSQAAPTGEAVKATEEKTLNSKERLENLVKVASVAVLELAKKDANEKYMAKFQEKMDKLIASAYKHNLPLPVGIAVGIDTDAGFMVGGDIGTELLFLMQDDGTVGFGVFPFIDLEAGAGAMLSRGVYVDLVFNLDKVADYEGYALGLTGDVGFVKDMDAEFAIGVDGKDLAGLKAAFKQMKSHQDHSLIIEDFKKVATASRCFVMGFGLGWGAGGKVMGFGGYWKKIYESKVQLNEASIRSEIEVARAHMKHAKRNLMKAEASKLRQEWRQKMQLLKADIKTSRAQRAAND